MKFLKKIFSPIVLTISFLLLIYTFYKSEIYFNGEERYYYFKYYILSFLLILFSIITFFINKKIKEYLIISVIGVVVSLYLFEVYLIYNYNLNQNQPKLNQKQFIKLYKNLSKEQYYKNKTGKEYDKRTKVEIYNDLKKRNDDIVMAVFPSIYLNKNYPIYPLSGISNSETIYCKENGYFSIYQSDRYGFNNPDEEWDKKEIEYLLVGDSFTLGACVNRPNDIASVLRTLSNKHVLNLGYGSNGPLLEYAILREYLNSNVKKVIWIYYANDLKDLNTRIKDKTLLNYINNLNFTQNLKLKQNQINDLVRSHISDRLKVNKIKKVTNKKFRFKIFKFLKITYTRTLFFPKTPAALPKFKNILELAKNLTNKNNSKLYFVYIPISEYKNDISNYNLVKNIVNELKIPFIDIQKEVHEKEDNVLEIFPYGVVGHFNEKGYRKVSEVIYKHTQD